MDPFKTRRGNWTTEYYWSLRRKHKHRRQARRRMAEDTAKEAREARKERD